MNQLQRIIIATIAGFLFGSFSLAQNVGVGTSIPDPSAKLEVVDTAKGILIPRLTQSQRDSITSPADGLLIYQTDTVPGFYYWNSSKWTRLAISSGNEEDWIRESDRLYSAPDSTMVIQSGKVGIGTVSPSGALNIAGGKKILITSNNEVIINPAAWHPNFEIATNEPQIFLNSQMGVAHIRVSKGAGNYPAYLRFENDGVIDWTIADSDADWGFGDDALTFRDNSGSDIVTMLQGGNVGIGTTGSNHQLELSLDDAAKPSTNTWTVVSDERLKNKTGSYNKELNELLKLDPIRYYYKNNRDSLFEPSVLDKENIGFTAQAVVEVFPKAVDTADNGYLGLNIHPIIIAYLNAIKELNTKDNELQHKIAKIKDLKSKNQEQDKKLNQLRDRNQELQQEVDRIKQHLQMQTTH